MEISRHPVIIGLVVIFLLAGVFWWNMKRDLNLKAPISVSMEDGSIEVEDMKITRFPGEDVWELNAKRAVRKKASDQLFQIVSDLTGPGGIRHLRAPAGVIDRTNGDLTLQSPEGDWQREIHPFVWKASQLIWKQKDDIWIFPKGVAVSGDTFALDGNYATVEQQQMVSVEGGKIRWWSEQ